MAANTAADPTYGYTAHLSGISFDGSVVSIARPEAMFQIVNREDVQPVAQEADERRCRVLDKISTGA